MTSRPSRMVEVTSAEPFATPERTGCAQRGPMGDDVVGVLPVHVTSVTLAEPLLGGTGFIDVQSSKEGKGFLGIGGGADEKFYFTVHDDAVAQRISAVMGKRVSLHYEEKVGLPTSCFGETRHYVTGVSVSDEIPLATGVVVQTPAGAASAAAAAAAAASAASK